MGTHLFICWKSGPWLEQQLKKNANIDLSVGKIHTNFLNTFSIDRAVLHTSPELKTSLSKISILPTLLPPGLAFHFKTGAPEWGGVVGTANFSLGKMRPWKMVFHADGLETEKTLGPQLSKKLGWGEFKGKLNIDGWIKGFLTDGFLTDEKKPTDWSIDLNGEHVQWVRDNTSQPLLLAGNLTVSPQKITIHKVNINKVLKVKGVIHSPWEHQTLELTAQTREATIDSLSTIAGHLNNSDLLSGKISLLARIEGKLSNPQMNGNFTFKSSYANVQLPSAEGNFQLADNKLELQSDFANGRFFLHGDIADSKSQRLSLSLEDISMSAIAKENGWINVNGAVNSQVQLTLAEDGADLTGQFQITQFNWGRFQTKPLISGWVDVNKNTIRLTTQDKSFVLRTTIQNGLARLDEFLLSFGKNSRLSAHGKANLKTGDLNFVLDGKNVPPDLWPPLVARYPDITGAMDIQGALSGTSSLPQADGTLSFSDLKFLPTGGAWNGTAKLIGSKEKISLHDIVVDGGYSGDLTWLPKKPQGLLTGFATMIDANPRLLADILKSSEPVTGTINGQLQIDMKSSAMTGISSFTWRNGQMGTFAFDRWDFRSTLKPEKIVLDDFSILRGPQALRGNGEASFNNNFWDYNLSIQFQHWGAPSFFIDGETIAKGRANWQDLYLDAKLEAPLLLLNDYSLENISAHLTHRNKLWTFKGSASPEISFDAGWRDDGSELSATINARAFQIEDLLARNFTNLPDIPHGLVSLKAHVSGRITDTRMKLTIQAPELTWHEEKLTSHINLDITKSTVSITSADMRLVNGGSFSLQGKIGRGESPLIHITGKGSKLNMQSIFHLLDWPIRWEGQADANFVMAEENGKKKIEVGFDGEQSGLGPFSGSGAISGRIVEEDGEWNLSGIRVHSGDGYVNLLPGSQIFFDRNGAGTMRLVLDMRNLKAGVLTFFGGVEVAGSWAGKSGLESQRRPTINMDIFARSLWINQYVLDGNVSHLKVKKGAIDFSPIPGSGQQLSGSMSYDDYPTIQMENFRLVDKGTEKLFLNGFIGTNKWDYTLNVKDVDAAVLSGLLDTTVAISGSMDLQVKGLGHPDAPDINANILWRNGHIDILPLDTAQGNLHYKNSVVSITDLHAVKKKGYQLSGKLRFDTNDSSSDGAKDPEIDIVVDKGDLAFLHEMWPEISKARGTFAGRFRMGRKSWGRSISGYLTADKVFVNSAYTPNLRKGELKIRLDKNRLHIDQAYAQLGEGILKLNGYVDFANGRPALYNLSLRTENEKGININIPQLSIPPGPLLGRFGFLKKRLAGASKGEPLLNLIFKGPADHPLLAGTIELVNTVFTFPPSNKRTANTKKTAVTRWLRSFADSIQWDLSLVAGARTWYENELVDANITGHLQFSGPTHDLDINGRIITEQGSIVYSGNEFRIKNAILEVETKTPALNDVDIKKTYVYLKANAEKDVYYTDALSNSNQDTIVMTVDRALLGEIQPRFYSRGNPNLSSERAFQLAMGLPISDSVDTNNLLPDQREKQATNEDTNKLLRIGLVQLLDASLASPLARAIARNTGLVDYIRVTYQDQTSSAGNVTSSDPAASSTANITQNQFLRYAKGTKVKFGRGISDRLFADYSFRVDEYQNKLDLRHEVELAYRLNKSFFLKGISELDSQRTLGRPPDRRALLENQWRFGLPRKKKKPLKESKVIPANSPQTSTKHS